MGKLIKNGREYGGVVVDTALDTTSTNPVQNKVVANAINTLNTHLTETSRQLVTGQIITKRDNYVTIIGTASAFISSGTALIPDGFRPKDNTQVVGVTAAGLTLITVDVNGVVSGGGGSNFTIINSSWFTT